MSGYDAILLVSFGGPEATEDVIPFLENVLRGKPVPRERMLEVAEHYYHFGGKSPINDQCREFLDALRPALAARNVHLPVYWGNRNWHPMLTDTVAQMTADGVQRALAFVTSAYSSYSGCRQYRENLLAAREAAGPSAPVIDKIRVFYNHPDFISVNAERVRDALAQLPADRLETTTLLFTAHSIPMSMANHCDYVRQLTETCRLVSEQLAWPAERSRLVYQSRSGRPQDPWLEPDIVDALESVHQADPDRAAAVVVPVGFLSDHLEIMYDLDEEARLACEQWGLPMVRSKTVGNDPRFVEMAAELIAERLQPGGERRSIGCYGPNHDVCPENCCLYPLQRPVGVGAASPGGPGGPPAGVTGGRPGDHSASRPGGPTA
jgi:protoporphyrin/coproporphyrin ferrochelatase